MGNVHGIILMTALPPTRGHQYLIDFALSYPGIEAVHVLVCERPGEPVSGAARAGALLEQYQCATAAGNRHRLTGLHVHLMAADLPQQPEDHPHFWTIWMNAIRARLPIIVREDDVVFASEVYGETLAGALRCRFAPCNLYREIVPVSASMVRAAPRRNFAEIMPAAQSIFRKTVTVFGAESTGKTTLSRRLARALPGHWCPEWAREYLEVFGSDLSDDKMEAIVDAQAAHQTAVHQLIDKPFVVRDTDLLSTLGYYRVYGGAAPDRLMDFIRGEGPAGRADLYLVMNDRVPFVPDRLRYGIDRRESDTAFWTNILTEFDCRFHVMESTDPDEQLVEAMRVCTELFDQAAEPLRAWTRPGNRNATDFAATHEGAVA